AHRASDRRHESTRRACCEPAGDLPGSVRDAVHEPGGEHQPGARVRPQRPAAISGRARHRADPRGAVGAAENGFPRVAGPLRVAPAPGHGTRSVPATFPAGSPDHLPPWRSLMRTALYLVAFLATLVALSLVCSRAADPPDEKLLLGFEDEDFARIGKAL